MKYIPADLSIWAMLPETEILVVYSTADPNYVSHVPANWFTKEDCWFRYDYLCRQVEDSFWGAWIKKEIDD